jgi:hypothetical protein
MVRTFKLVSPSSKSPSSLIGASDAMQRVEELIIIRSSVVFERNNY